MKFSQTGRHYCKKLSQLISWSGLCLLMIPAGNLAADEFRSTIQINSEFDCQSRLDSPFQRIEVPTVLLPTSGEIGVELEFSVVNFNTTHADGMNKYLYGLCEYKVVLENDRTVYRRTGSTEANTLSVTMPNEVEINSAQVATGTIKIANSGGTPWDGSVELFFKVIATDKDFVINVN